MNIRKNLLSLAVICCLSVVESLANVPNFINLQGTLTDSSGNPVTGIRTIQFSIYSDSVGGIPIWNELHWSVSVEDGLFHVLLGSTTSFPSSLFSGNTLWLGIQISPDPAELYPRQQIACIAYSMKAGTADDADMVDGRHYSTAWEPDGYNPDNVPGDSIRGEPTWNEVSNRDYGRSGVTDTLYEGTRRLSELYVNENQANSITSNMIQDSTILFRDIGQNGATTNQVMKWSGTGWTASNDVSGTITLPYSDSLSSILSGFTVTNTNLGNAIYGKRTYSGATNYGYLGGAYGVYGQQSTGNKGYLGGASYGVYGYHQSTGNWGGLGDANYGVYGRHSSTNEGYLGSSTVGVYGKEGTTNNFGYLGSASLGAYGKNVSSNNYGQLGATLYGVYGYATGASRDGVFGSHSSGNYGYLADDYFGIYGRYQTTGNYGYIGSSDYGVYGINISTNNFGYLGGTVGAYGRHYATGNYGYLGGDSSGVYARCSTTSNNMCAVRAENTGRGDGVYATVTGTTGSSAVKAEALAGTPSNSYAVEAVNYGSGGGVYAKCQAGGYALQATGDSYLDGDVRVRDTLTVDDGIRGNQDSLVVHGSLNVTGAMYGFPRPDYDSGWFSLGTGEEQSLYHDLGGDPSDYFVDLQMMENSDGTLNNRAIGMDKYYIATYEWGLGAYWRELSPTRIEVYKGSNADTCDSLRVRIWVIK
jgi:hypothetical protein